MERTENYRQILDYLDHSGSLEPQHIKAALERKPGFRFQRMFLFDLVILAIALVLVGVGVVMIYSSSAALSLEQYGDSSLFLKRQLFWGMLGMIFMLICLSLDLTFLRRLTYPLLLIAILLLFFQMIFGMKTLIGGAKGWLWIGMPLVHAAELSKLSLVLYLAYSLVKKQARIHDFTFGYLPNVLVLSLFFLLTLSQPDVGSAFLILLLSLLICLAAGVKLAYLVMTFLVSLPFLVISFSTTSDQYEHLLDLLHPWSSTSYSHFYLVQSLFALRKGGSLNQGESGAPALLSFLELRTNFILTAIGEKFGLIIFLFGVLIWRGIRVALGASDLYRTYLALGATLLIALQFSMNVGMVSGFLPFMAISLPFMSLDPWALLVNMGAIGILLNISR